MSIEVLSEYASKYKGEMGVEFNRAYVRNLGRKWGRRLREGTWALTLD